MPATSGTSAASAGEGERGLVVEGLLGAAAATGSALDGKDDEGDADDEEGMQGAMAGLSNSLAAPPRRPAPAPLVSSGKSIPKAFVPGGGGGSTGRHSACGRSTPTALRRAFCNGNTGDTRKDLRAMPLFLAASMFAGVESITQISTEHKLCPHR